MNIAYHIVSASRVRMERKSIDSYINLLHTYTVMRPDNAFSALYNNTEQRANIRANKSICPHTAFRPSPGFATYRELSMGERRLQSTYSERLLHCDVIFKRI